MEQDQSQKPFESLEELERIEGNYYKVDLFVASALVLFTVWVFALEKNELWAVLLGLISALFFFRGGRRWWRQRAGRH